MTTATEMKPSEVLRAAKALITAPAMWMKGCGNYANCERDAPHCADGAIFHAADCDEGQSYTRAIYLFAMAVQRVGIAGVTKWNDAPGRTHTEVMEAFDKAIALAQSEEAQSQ